MEAGSVASLPRLEKFVNVTDQERFQSNNECALIVYAYQEGFIVHVPPDRDSFDDYVERAILDGFSHAVTDLLKIARKNGCIAIWLDGAGPIYDKLPQFKW